MLYTKDMKTLTDVITTGIIVLLVGGLVIALFAGIEKLGEWLSNGDG